jgi:hypothetical protein
MTIRLCSDSCKGNYELQSDKDVKELVILAKHLPVGTEENHKTSH